MDQLIHFLGSTGHFIFVKFFYRGIIINILNVLFYLGFNLFNGIFSFIFWSLLILFIISIELICLTGYLNKPYQQEFKPYLIQFFKQYQNEEQKNDSSKTDIKPEKIGFFTSIYNSVLIRSTDLIKSGGISYIKNNSHIEYIDIGIGYIAIMTYDNQSIYFCGFINRWWSMIDIIKLNPFHKTKIKTS